MFTGRSISSLMNVSRTSPDGLGPAADFSLPPASSVTKRYKAFVSYSHADTKWARWLMRRLESYRVPKRFYGRSAPVGMLGPRLGPIFRDRDELPTTTHLGETIRAALRESATLVVVCSPDSARSKWVQQEIIAFKLLHGERSVFAFIVGGEPKLAGMDDDCFSPALRFEVGADGMPSLTRVDVVAADARPHGDGPRLAFVRLVAGLLGVGFDELRQRELQRRNRRLTLIATASVVGMAITLLLAVTAWQARSDAVLARDDAQRRQNQAEDVLTFMVGDFRTELKKLGRLSLLDAVGDKATTYFDSLDPRDLSDKSLLSQAQALIQIGENRMEEARYAEAARAFATAHVRATALAARHPESGDALFWRGQSEYWVGFVHWKRGNLAAAGEWMTRYRDTGAVLASFHPSQANWQGELAYGHHNLAVLEMDRGHSAPAREGFLRELAMLIPMSAANPGDLDLQFRITDINSWLGSLAEQAGNFSEAGERFAEQSRGLETLMQADPHTAKWKVKLADALAFQSSLRAITGRRSEAVALRKRARELIDPLVLQDPANRTWLGASLSLRLREAMLQVAEGNETEAATLVTEARAGYEKLHAAEPSARGIVAQLAMAWRLEAELRDRTGHPDAAAAADRAMALGRTLVSENSANEGYLGEYVKACVVAGGIAEHEGDHSRATGHWNAALTAAQSHFATSNYWRLLDPGARAFAALGQSEESRQLIERLTKFGYEPLLAWP
jgi:hypothetical protein